MANFYDIKVKEIKKETQDSVSISFDIPSELKEMFNYSSGQYITLKQQLNQEEVIRSYSLCSSPLEEDFRIGVKVVPGGLMSTFLNKDLFDGQSLKVMSPEGNFVVKPFQDESRNYVGIAAGSGVTPILSMMKTVLLGEPKSTFTLYYANKTEDSTMFKSEIEEFEARFPNQLKVYRLFTQENQANSLYHGRIDQPKFSALMAENKEIVSADGVYICGPEGMIYDVSKSLTETGYSKDKIHYELFGTPVDKMKVDAPEIVSDFEGESQVTAIMDGEEFEFTLSNDDAFILDASMDNGVDAPFSCKGAVCCTCKAQVIEGKATMDLNYALSEEEVEEGFILTCQARPASAKLVVDFDVI
jgi:ring-1,2-phenylacetyl-CoA epoxidase subunit PaaE